MEQKPLQHWMDEKGFSIRSLSSATGKFDNKVSVSSIQDLLRGHKYDKPDKPIEPHPNTMRVIAQVLEVEIMQISEFVRAIEFKRGKENRQHLIAINALAV